MAKQINIDFTGQPITTGQGFLYTIQINGFNIYFPNGSIDCVINFIPNGGTPVNDYDLPIGATLEDTLQITLNFLRAYYYVDIISYTLVGNVIQVLIQADAVVTIDGDVNDSLTITTEDVEPSGENLIYFLIFDDYTLNIFKKNYLGTSSEIYGSFALKKSSVDTILTPIRGTGLDLSLEANQSLTFDEFILNDEFTFKTELLKGSQTIFKGYIKPDGVQQSYVNDQWLINIESVDGLGLLKDLSFVQQNGLPFIGKLSIYDIIKGCLDRTRLEMTINTSITIEYNGYAGTNILKDVYVNTERFIKDSNDTIIMDCNEVLTSMLNMFSGVITQQDGQWWIYRPNDLEFNGYTEFINQTTNATFTKNLNIELGSQIDNYYPHHCDANQQIEVKGAISAYRLNYEYGFLNGLLQNPNLNHDDELNYDNWTVNPSLPANILVNDPLRTSGALIVTTPIDSFTKVLTSDPVAGIEGTTLTISIKLSVFISLNFFYFKIKTSDGYYLSNSNNWVTDTNAFIIVSKGSNGEESFLNYERIMPPLINDCTIEIIIGRPIAPIGGGLTNISYCQILDNQLKRDGIVGEFHTVTRFNPPSSITKENQKVFNGDGDAILVGSIYKDDMVTLTTSWTRKDKFESLPLLGISAMDDLRIQANAIKVFSGSIYGEIPYMSVITINNIVGLFMPIEYDYDYKTNISQVKLLQFYNDDIADIQYEVSPDYGNNTIKPTIKG